MPEHPKISAIVTTFNDAEYLVEAIESIRAQTVAAAEIIVVDDGSRDDPTPLLDGFPEVQVIRQANAGLAPARNTGLASATGEFIFFLDADDRLLPEAIEEGVNCFAANPGAAFVYGAHRRIAADGQPLGADRFSAVGAAPFEDLLRGNLVAMHATVLYQTNRLRAAGGFAPSLRRCEDYDLYLRLAQHNEVACHPNVIAEYRWHGANMSHDIQAMLQTVLRVHERYRGGNPAERRAWREGRKSWRDYYARELTDALLQRWRSDRNTVGTIRAAWKAVLISPGAVLGRIAEGVVQLLRDRLRRRTPGIWPPRIGKVRFGHFGSTRPVSGVFGFDRGLPIDRHYIEAFLQRHSADIGGDVLEIGDDSYSRRFGAERIRKQDILHVHAGNPIATLVGDLCDPAVVRDDSFDCMILTQTLHLIYDFHEAVRRMHAALKPGGVLLLTVPGITQIDREEWGSSWYWSFTQHALVRLFQDAFGNGSFTVEVHGNVFAATTFLHGLAVEEVPIAKLDVVDPAYPVILGVRAVKR